jgi:hypothetical protein
MSDNTVEVIENITTLEITSSTESETSVVEIVQSGVVNLELSTVLPLLPSNFTNNTKTIISETLVGGSGIVIGPLTSGSIVVSTSGLQPSGNYSLVGHSHNSSDITNFNSSVSGLLPVKNISAGSGIGISNSSGDFTVSVTGTFGLTGEQVDDRVDNLLKAGSYVNLNYNDSLDSLTISVSGLQPSGNYSLVGHSHEISDINNLQNALDNKQPSGIYASGIHYHVASDITDFNSSVSGLLPASFDAAVPWTANHTLVDGTRYLVNDLVYENGRLYRANYENESIPTSSDLYWTDVGPGYRLNIDGRDIPNVPYPVKNIISGSGISVSSSNGDFTVAVSGQFGLTGEEVDDRINDLLIAGSNIILNYDDLANQLTISTSGLQPSGNYSVDGHSHTSSDITDFSASVSGLVSGIYAPLNSPALTGIPTAPTAPSGTNDSQIANTSFVRTEISNLVDSAPTTLDTLNELAAALGDDPNFATTVTNLIGNKVSKSGDTMTGTLYAPSGVFSSGLSLNGTTVSVSGHTHSYTDITNWASGIDSTLSTLLVAGDYINLDHDTNLGTLTISASGLQPSGNYSLVGHTHIASNISDFNSSVSGLLPVKNVVGSGYAVVSSSSGVYTISTSGLQPSGNYSLVGHSHTTSDITDFNSGVSGLLPVKNVLGSGYVNVSSSSGNYTISVSGLQPSGNYANSIHTHTTSDITDFNSSVSGLIPVKNILAGSGIVVSSTSGIYTIDANISGVILETIQDNLGSGFLVAGTGVKLTYNDVANTLRLDNLHTEINELSLEPQGFVNRLDSIISFNDSTRTFTIAPTGASYDVYIEGVKVTKTTSESIVIGSGTALNYIHFNTDTGLLDTKTTFFNFDTDVPIAFIHWNGDINQSTFFGEERHGIRMDSMTHKWIHNTFGMQYINGLSIGGYTLLGNGSSNSHAQIDISDGTLYQEDIIINIVDGNNGVEFTQQLSPIAYIPVYYHSGSTGQWVRDVSTPYPLKYNATRALYNLYSGGTWTTPNVPNNRYFAMWIVATNDMNDPILAIMGQREDSSLGAAENNNIWSDINLTNIPTNELRPLYRLIFLTNATFTNTPKSSLQSILDIRKSVITSTYGVSQNDHGSLFGLGDDDHAQYVHINEARSISANHTFTNGLTISSGLLSANSGNFTSLSVNNVQVSVSGHTHTASNITNFNSSVSGLFPANLTTGVGTSGYVSRWNGTNSLTSGIIYDNGTNVGLGTSTPSETLHVIGSGRFSGDVTALGSLIAGSGTASLPSIEFISDADTGAFSPAANTFAVSTSGTERLRITGTGAVGINTTAPSGRLHVFGDSYSQGSLYISRSGTTVPITYNRLFNDTSDSLVIRGGDNEIALGGQGGTISIKAFSQWTEIGNNYNAGTTAQHIKFTPAATERMRLTNTGNLGIGTTAPSGRLHVAGGSGLFSSVTTGIAPNALLHAYSATSGDTVLNVEGTNGSLFSVIDSLSGSLMSVNNNAGLPVFEVFSNDSIVAGRYNLNDFVINSSGNIGIGQNNPSEKLEVAGNIKANNIIHPFLFMGG